MLLGALIGLIVGIIIMFIKKNQEKKALDKVLNNDLIDTPDFAGIFFYSTEERYNKGGLKIFDSNGAGTLHNNQFVYEPFNKGEAISIDLSEVNIKRGDKDKRKMKWVSFDKGGTKHYFTSYKTGFWQLDKSGMDTFLQLVNEIKK